MQSHRKREFIKMDADQTFFRSRLGLSTAKNIHIKTRIRFAKQSWLSAWSQCWNKDVRNGHSWFSSPVSVGCKRNGSWCYKWKCTTRLAAKCQKRMNNFMCVIRQRKETDPRQHSLKLNWTLPTRTISVRLGTGHNWFSIKSLDAKRKWMLMVDERFGLPNPPQRIKQSQEDVHYISGACEIIIIFCNKEAVWSKTIFIHADPLKDHDGLVDGQQFIVWYPLKPKNL